MDEHQVNMLKNILDKHLDEHIKQIQVSREHTNKVIEDTIKVVVNGKIDSLHKKVDAYIVEDAEWKKKASPALETYENLQGFNKISKWLFGIIIAIGSLWALFNKI